MQFVEIGNENGKTLMLLPGTCCDYQTNFANVLGRLADKYHLICVNYDGFDGSDAIFPDMITVTEKIERYIKDNHNGSLDGALGSSLGSSFVGQLIQRRNVHLDHGIFGSPDLDQSGRLSAKLQAKLVVPLLTSFTGSEKKREKTRQKLKDFFLMSDEAAGRFMECFAKFDPESIKNEYYTDLLTWLDEDIHVDGTKVHFIYANKMGEKYLKRYKKYFRDPDIREFDMQHEQWLFGGDEYAEPVLKAIDEFMNDETGSNVYEAYDLKTVRNKGKIYRKALEAAGIGDVDNKVVAYEKRLREMYCSENFRKHNVYPTTDAVHIYSVIAMCLELKEMGLTDAQIIDAVNKGFSVRRNLFGGLIKCIDCLPFAYRIAWKWNISDHDKRVKDGSITYDVFDVSPDRIEYSISKCVYVEMFETYGIRSLCKIFCMTDTTAYENLSKHVKFIRHSDLSDGDCCHDEVADRRTLYPKKYEKKMCEWLKIRYGNQQTELIWDKTMAKYRDYLKESPDYGGTKNGHAMSIYGSMLVFAMIESLPDQPQMDELQRFTQDLFMEPFVKLGKIFDLDRARDIALIDKVFRKVAKRDNKDSTKWPCGFHTVYDGFDKAKGTTSYHFNQCPVAEFAKKHDLLHYLPLMCNCDFYGIEQIHGQLIREGTCGNSDRCDYLIAGRNNQIVSAYETLTDDKGFLVSRKKDS